MGDLESDRQSVKAFDNGYTLAILLPEWKRRGPSVNFFGEPIFKMGPSPSEKEKPDHKAGLGVRRSGVLFPGCSTRRAARSDIQPMEGVRLLRNPREAGRRRRPPPVTTLMIASLRRIRQARFTI